MDVPNIEAMLQKALDIRKKVTAAIRLSNAYAGAYRAQPLARVQSLAACIDQIDQLLSTLKALAHAAEPEYALEAASMLWEVVDVHDQLANAAVRESLEPIPGYIQKHLDRAHLKLAEVKGEFLGTPLAKVLATQ